VDELGVDRAHAHVAVARALDAHLVAVGLLVEVWRHRDTFAADRDLQRFCRGFGRAAAR